MRLSRKPKIPSLKVENGRTGFFEQDQFKRLLRYLPHHVRPVIQFAYFTGWRIPSEVLTLTWWQVNFSGWGGPARARHDQERRRTRGRRPLGHARTRLRRTASSSTAQAAHM